MSFAGGRIARPTVSAWGSMVPRKASTPFSAFWIFCPAIEPVRSSTIITSSGTPPHGEHAWACALSVIVGNPSSFSR
jgi:hypothetical protein